MTTRSRVPAALLCALIAVVATIAVYPEVDAVSAVFWALAAVVVVAALDRGRARRRVR